MHKYQINKYWLLVIVSIGIFSFQQAKAESGIVITPAIIDAKVKNREQQVYKIKINNQNSSHVFLYATASEVSTSTEKQTIITEPGGLDRGKHISTWLKFSRGVMELAPGQEKEFPVEVRINQNASPGKYFGGITFTTATNGYEAEEKARALNKPDILISFEVLDQVVEKAQVIQFKSIRPVFWDNNASFVLSIKNNGNTKVVPKGSIHLYDRQGEEIDSIDINPQAAEILADDSKDFSLSWSNNKEIGKYKARLIAEYGEKEKGELQDSIFFWIIPQRLVALFASGLLALVILLSVIIFKISYKRYPERNLEFVPVEEDDVEEREDVINLRDQD